MARGHRNLADIDENTPHHFQIELRDSSHMDAAQDVLDGRISREIVYRAGPDRTTLELASTFSPRTSAVMRPINALHRAGVTVARIDFLDLVTDISSRKVAQAIGRWEQHGNRGPHRRRCEALAGERALAAVLGFLDRWPDRRRSAALFTLGCIAFNTPGAESAVMRLARQAEWNEAGTLVGYVADRATLARLAGASFDVAPEDLVPLVERSDYVGERAAHVARQLPGPLPPQLVNVLVAAAHHNGGEHGAALIYALHQAEPDEALRATLDGFIAASSSVMRAAALEVATAHWGVAMRPNWLEFLQSRTATLRHSAESIIGTHGDEDDLEVAANHLGKLIRGKPSAVSWSPPRGSEIIALLVRHAAHPTARAGLDDLSARWEKLSEDLRTWLEGTHPELEPGARSDEPSQADSPAEEDLKWPLPEITLQDDGRYHLWFEQTDMFETAERFQTLALADPRVTPHDGDREWVVLEIGAPDPEAVIAELWEQAGGTPER